MKHIYKDVVVSNIAEHIITLERFIKSGSFAGLANLLANNRQDRKIHPDYGNVNFHTIAGLLIGRYQMISQYHFKDE